PAGGGQRLRADGGRGLGGGAVRRPALGRGQGPQGLRALQVDRGPAASERAWAPAHRRPFPRPARGARPPGRASTWRRADQPAADPPGRDHLDGHKGTAWVLRRSTDLVPYLLAMAV